MDLSRFVRRSDYEWEIAPHGAMRVPAVIYASEALIRAMDDKVYEQAVNVATLPGIVKASYAMPDAHWGYGFPIGGVAAFDPDEGGVVSAGGVGFDISCGVRCLHTGLARADILAVQKPLADILYHRIPAGVGSTGAIRLGAEEMDAMLAGGAKWAVDRGWGEAADLDRIEERGQMKHAKPLEVSPQAKKRQRDEMGTLGSGNHYLEVQEVTAVHDAKTAAVFGLAAGRHRGHDPLRLARARPPDRHRLPEADGDRRCGLRDHPPRPRARVRADQLGRRRGVSGRDARGDQLRPRQPPDPHPPPTPGLPRHPAAGAAAAALRRVAQHLQGRGAPHGRRRAQAVRPPQGRDARVRAGSSGPAGAAPRGRAAGADRRLDGHRLVRARRDEGIRGARVQLGVSRRRPRDEPPPGASHVAGPPGDRRARRARHPDPQPVRARRRGRGARRLQGRRGGGGRRGCARGSRARWRASNRSSASRARSPAPRRAHPLRRRASNARSSFSGRVFATSRASSQPRRA